MMNLYEMYLIKILFYFQDDTYTESYISTIGVDFVSIFIYLSVCYY